MIDWLNVSVFRHLFTLYDLYELGSLFNFSGQTGVCNLPATDNPLRLWAPARSRKPLKITGAYSQRQSPQELEKGTELLRGHPRCPSLGIQIAVIIAAAIIYCKEYCCDFAMRNSSTVNLFRLKISYNYYCYLKIEELLLFQQVYILLRIFIPRIVFQKKFYQFTLSALTVHSFCFLKATVQRALISHLRIEDLQTTCSVILRGQKSHVPGLTFSID